MSHRILRHTIHPTAYVATNVRVGKDVMIGPHASIGWDGFGYYRVPDGWNRKPQTHGVVIEDDVHIGANTCIDRGSYRDTVIGEGTKIDNLVHIAHNVQVGKRCMVIAQAMLAGSVELGDDCWIAPHAVIREHVRIGNGAFVALGAVVTEDVPDCTSVRGVPAKPFQPRESPIAIPASA